MVQKKLLRDDMKYMKEIEIMKINILKKDNGKIVFEFDETEYEYDYDGLDKFIEKSYSNNDEVEINCDDEFEEYKILLNNILIECRKDDFKNAVNKAIESNKELEELNDGD